MDEQTVVDRHLAGLQDEVNRLTRVKALRGDLLVDAEQISGHCRRFVGQNALAVGDPETTRMQPLSISTSSIASQAVTACGGSSPQ